MRIILLLSFSLVDGGGLSRRDSGTPNFRAPLSRCFPFFLPSGVGPLTEALGRLPRISHLPFYPFFDHGSGIEGAFSSGFGASLAPSFFFFPSPPPSLARTGPCAELDPSVAFFAGCCRSPYAFFLPRLFSEDVLKNPFGLVGWASRVLCVLFQDSSKDYLFPP